jgi:hypothetical protein
MVQIMPVIGIPSLVVREVGFVDTPGLILAVDALRISG